MQKGQSQRFEALDGWRGVCALAVALNHLWFAGHYRQSWAVNNFHLFVDYFFVLSGFVIYHSYADRVRSGRDLAVFAVRRLGRIYPLHLATLALLVLYELMQLAVGMHGTASPFTGREDVPSLIANLLLLQGMGVNGGGTWNAPSWSISVEFFLYLTFGAALVVLGKRRMLPVSLTLLVLGGAVIRLIAPHIMDSTYDYGFARGLLGFFSGCLVCMEVRRGMSRKIGTAGEIAMLALIAVFLSLVGTGYWSMLSTPIFALAVWVFSHESGAVSQVLKTSVGRALGRWSFSIYLWHYAMIVVLVAMLKLCDSQLGWPEIIDQTRPTDGAIYSTVNFGSAWANDVAAIAFLLVVVAVAAASYRLIEVPGQRLAKRFADRIEGRAKASEVTARDGSMVW